MGRQVVINGRGLTAGTLLTSAMAAKLRRSTSQRPSNEFLSTATAQMTMPSGRLQKYNVVYDSRTGMPHPYHITVSDPARTHHSVQVFDCTPLSELIRVVATQLKTPPEALNLLLNAKALTGDPRCRIGRLGVLPGAHIVVQIVDGATWGGEGCTRSHKLTGVQADIATQEPKAGLTRRASSWSGMVSKRGSIESNHAPRMPRRARGSKLLHTAHVYSCYSTRAPLSPTTQCQLYKTLPVAKKEVQIEFGDSGLYFRREPNWKPKPYGRGERRFSYFQYNQQNVKNPYAMVREPSTKPWQTPWELHLSNQAQIWREGGLVPHYDVFDDPNCAQFAQRLYNNVGEEPKDESAHEFWKRQEEENSNTFQRARRRSVELFESMDSKVNQTTASSRRRSVTEVATPGKYQVVDHAAAAREATKIWEEQQGSAKLHRAKTPLEKTVAKRCSSSQEEEGDEYTCDKTIDEFVDTLEKIQNDSS